MKSSLFSIFLAVVKRGVELKVLVNEHASHKYLMKKYLRKLSDKVKNKRRSANIQLKFFSVSKYLKLFSRIQFIFWV